LGVSVATRTGKQVTREGITTHYLCKLDFRNSPYYILSPKQTAVIGFISMNFSLVRVENGGVLVFTAFFCIFLIPSGTLPDLYGIY